MEIGEPERELRLLVPLVGSAPEPPDGLGVVMRDTNAQPVHETEVELTARMPLLGRTAVPLGRLQVVLVHAVAVMVHAAELELRFSVSEPRFATDGRSQHTFR